MCFSDDNTRLVLQTWDAAIVYDLTTGNAQARLRFKTGAAFTRFSLDGKRLLVLTAGQVAYAFDTDRIVAK